MNHSSPLTRRRFLLAATGSVIAASQGFGPAAANPDAPSGVPGSAATTSPASAPATPLARAFRQQLRDVPQIDWQDWSLAVGASQATVIDIAELLTMPAASLPATLACIGNRPGGPLITHAGWQGVPFPTLIERTNLPADTPYVHFIAADGYATSLPSAQLTDAILAYAMNGEPLAREHGAPLRLVVPGLYGYKMPKWVQRIEFGATPIVGPWEARGWSPVGSVQTTSAFHTPRHRQTVHSPVTFSGMAYAGKREIVSVELSIDDGPWMPAPINPGPPNSALGWQIDWSPPAPGDYLAKVRATDSSGFTQYESEAAPFPNGSSAIHSIIVRVAAD